MYLHMEHECGCLLELGRSYRPPDSLCRNRNVINFHLKIIFAIVQIAVYCKDDVTRVQLA